MTEIRKAIAAQTQTGDRSPQPEPIQRAIAQAPLQALRSRGVGIDRILNFAL
ncbi:MAG: hypothetical protein HC881_14175 [Leptolyngbyaceae cyanobacterium SL_7_1]|nr:hypothetical protein [Leptolyngbyaceae cyanobacterium SL_7_1]